MEYIGFIFGIFGLLAYLQVASLKARVSELERQLTVIPGTTYEGDRQALVKAACSLIGEQVIIELKEDHEDNDIMMYGNTKHGSNTIIDADEQWLLIRTVTPKAEKEKLIRMESIQQISRIVE